jgi:hypothetical protein
VSYELEEKGSPTLGDVLDGFLARTAPGPGREREVLS